MNKKILRTIGALLLTTALVISLIPVSDVEASSTSDFQMEGSKLVKYTGTAEVVSIPDEVRTIGEEAFAGNSDIVKVNINDKCKQIEYGAFKDCVGLHSVVVGAGVEEIGSAAFSNDKSLKNFNIGASVKKIGSATWAGDTSLTNLTVDSANKHFMIKDNVLYDDELKRVYYMLPSYKNGEYIMPNSVNEIMGYAFWGNDSIKNVSLSSNLVSVPAYAFSNFSNLKQVTIPLPVRSIDAKAFEDCVNLSLVNCPDSLTNIADSAFDGCPKVTLNAKPGSYAYEFGQDLAKSLIDEIEYEDVEEAAIISTEVVKPQSVENLDSNETVVVAGSPNNRDDGDGVNDVNVDTDGDGIADTNVDTDGDGIADINVDIDGDGIADTNVDTDGDGDGNGSSTGDNNNLISNPAKYYNGVISGYNVVGYNTYDPSTDSTDNLMGASSVVSGRALIFIENNNKVRPYESSNDDMVTTSELNDNGEIEDTETVIDLDAVSANDDNETLGSVISEDASKGMNFPKFTVVGNRIASQGYYLDKDLTSYEIPEDIKVIGDFAFARSGLKSIEIPDGVESIGYGAFYHCDDLGEVSIPSSVKSIKGYAFENTSFVNNYPDDFVIVGDGILIAYKGTESIVTIPEGVKLIADGAFKDHMGITAVNLANTLEVIGEDAFSGCGNLNTVNRGENVKNIGANAFKGCALNNVTIHPNVEAIGIGAFDLSNGTDTVTFEGTQIPVPQSGFLAKRLANNDDRTYVFGNITKAVVPAGVNDILGTVLEPGTYGIKGIVVDEFGNTVSDNTSGVALRDNGFIIDVNSSTIDALSVSGYMTDDENTYLLHINDSQNAKESISLAYSELYGGRKPDNMVGYDISLMDASDTISIEKLGKQYVDLSMKIPSGISADNLHVVCLDEDGQLEAVEYTLSEDGSMISFTCKHFSPYGMYNYEGISSVSKTGDTKDDTPNTGDGPIHPKWFLVIGLGALAILVFILSGKKSKA